MPRYIDVEGYRKLFDEEYKKTRKLISEGETHLDNLAEGFSEAGRVIDRMPTADVVPREALDQLKTILKEVWLEKAGFEGAAKQIIEGLKAEVEKYRSVVERDIVIVGRRQGKEAESREIIRYRADLIREAAVREFAESLLEGRVGNDPVSVAVRVGLKSFLEEERKDDDH